MPGLEKYNLIVLGTYGEEKSCKLDVCSPAGPEVPEYGVCRASILGFVIESWRAYTSYFGRRPVGGLPVGKDQRASASNSMEVLGPRAPATLSTAPLICASCRQAR